jgi:hypothetical protein
MICKFCLEEKKCIKCHIIPRSFFKSILKPHALIISDKFNSKRSQTGIYDENLVCKECEKLFSPFDDYACHLLLSDIPTDDVMVNQGGRIAYLITDYNYNKLKLFFISLLWRVSSSKLPYFDLVNVKSFDNRLKEMILKQDVGIEDEFSIALRRFEERSYSRSMLNPHNTKFEGINYVMLYLGGYTVYIKVDKRVAPDFIRDVSISPNKPLSILLVDINKTSEFRVMKKLAERQKDKFGKVK